MKINNYRKTKNAPGKEINRIIAVYKPKGPTSNDILNDIKKKLGLKRGVGHAGTLDPLARGMLVVGIGKKATKKLKDIIGLEKEYIATIRLGMESATDDAEGKKKELSVAKKPSFPEIKDTIKTFEGRISQVPPRYSAIKINGKEAYKRVRKGEKIFLKPRRVQIQKIEIIKYKWPLLKLKVVTGPGVYIRSLARDLGRKLRVGGYVSDLERIRVGNFSKEKAVAIEDL